VKAVRDENPHVRLASALALWQIARHAAAVPVAVETLADQDHFVRRKAASTLGEMSAETDDALQSLVAALSDEDRYVRIDAALALWGIRRDPLALSCLRNLTQNCPDEKIRRYAARLIQNLEQEQSTELGKE
jgi:HEAT repeat protein